MHKLILITGGSASGKTTVAESIIESLGDESILISQDNFYKKKGSKETNYDEPDAFDFELQNKVMQKLLEGETAGLPIYDFSNHSRRAFKDIESKRYIVFEGLFSFDSKFLTDNALFKIFVDTPADTRFARRVVRDVNERGRKLTDVVDRWIKDVQPSYKEYISKHKSNADIIIPWSAINKKSIKAVISAVQHTNK